MALNDSDTLFDNTTVTAGWNAKTYTVTINPNGAGGSSKTYSVRYGQSWQVPSCPFSRTGYNFSGYSGGYSAGQTITITGNITMSCNWSVRYYTISIYPNGASGSAKTYNVAYGNSFTFPSCPFTRSGYNFKGYATSASGSASYQANNSISNVTSNKSFYCVWTDARTGGVVSFSLEYSYATGQNTTVLNVTGARAPSILSTDAVWLKAVKYQSSSPSYTLRMPLNDLYRKEFSFARTAGSNMVRSYTLYYWFESKGETTAQSLFINYGNDYSITMTY